MERIWFFVSAGLVNLKQFSEQENFWGHRYVFKSFQEEYGIAFCEDIGVVAGYEFSPVISADIALTNGEGRKFKNMDNHYKYGAGVTVKPIDGLIFRLYGDIYNIPKFLTDGDIIQKDQYSIATFVGYQNQYFPLERSITESLIINSILNRMRMDTLLTRQSI